MSAKAVDRSLRTTYEQLVPLANRFTLALREQFEQLLFFNGLTLGVPIESRVKSWDSISEKVERQNLVLYNVCDLDDLIGLRLIMLFQKQ